VKRRLSQVYGSTPLHLVAVLASIAVTAYAASRLVQDTGNWPRVALWFVAAAVLHDIVLFPLYTLLDRIAAGRRLRGAVNFVRVPALISAVLLAVSLPLVFSAAPETYESASGLRPDPYLERWLAVTAVLFLGSGLVYAVRARRRGEPAPAAS